MTAELDGSEARFIVSVEDVTGVYAVLQPLLESRPVWKNLQLRNKVGISVNVPELQVQYLLSSNQRLVRLRQHAQSPVTWFRNPYVQLILISGDDPDEYKRSLKGQVRKAMDRDRDLLGGAPEFVIAYVQPAGADPLSKGAKKVFEAVRNDIGTRKKERAVRLDIGPRGLVHPHALAELERQLSEALKLTFEARQAAYAEEVRKLTAERQQAGWSFSTLFLVKDSLAIMLESAGLLEDALREYAELEALWLTSVQQPGLPNAQPFGGSAPGDDNAQLVRATWRETRQSVLRHGLVPFEFQQFLFACQARILLKLNRPAEVAERGLGIVKSFGAVLEKETEAGRLPALFKEAWTFSACLSLANTTVRIGPPPPTPAATPAAAPPRQVSLPPLPTGLHKRATSEVVQDTSSSSQLTKRHTKSLTATDFAAISEGSTPDASSAAEASSQATESEEEEDAIPAPLTGSARETSVESTTLQHRKMLPRVKVGRSAKSGIDTPANGRPPGKQKGPAQRRSKAGSDWKMSLTPEIDWQLGVSGHLQGGYLADAAAVQAAGQEALDGGVESARQRHFWCLLGHLYAKARHMLTTMGDNLGVPLASPKASDAAPNGAASASEVASRNRRGHVLAPARSDPASQTAAASQQLPPLPPSLNDTSLATAESAIATPKHELLGRPPVFEALPQHVRRLSRFGPTAGHGRSDSVNSLAQHSRRSSVSEMSNSGAVSEAESVGSLVRRGSDYDAQRPEPDLRNILTVEAEVETASEDSGSPNSQLRGEGPDAAKCGLRWLTEWRLTLALSSVERYQELWVELSGSASACYIAAGWRRTSERMLAQVAELLLTNGQLAAAATITQRQAKLFAAQGWMTLSAQLLQSLARCQKQLYKALSIGLCIRLLSLPEKLRGSDQEWLGQLQKSFLQSSASSAQPNALELATETSDGSLQCSQSLWIEAVPTYYSRFFGQSEVRLINTFDELLRLALGPFVRIWHVKLVQGDFSRPGLPNVTVDGEPITSASRGVADMELPVGNGALKACVGDVVKIPVHLVSRLPEPLTVAGCELALSVLQEITIVISPRGGPDNPLTRGLGHLRTTSVRSLDSPTVSGSTIHRQQPSGVEAGTPGTAVTAVGDPQQRFGTKWQETEVVRCSLAEGGAPDGTVTLKPGGNTLWFEVVPLKRGLYALKHVTVTLGEFKLRLEYSPLHKQAPADVSGRSALGSCNVSGSIGEEAVLMHVDSALQRVALRGIAPQGALIAGLSQWLGVAVVPQHDLLTEATIQFQPQSSTGRAKGPVSVDFKPDHTGWVAPLQATNSIDVKLGQGVDIWQESTSEAHDSVEANVSQSDDAESWRLGANQIGALPAWVFEKPCLLWSWVHTGTLPSQHETVRVNPLSSYTPLQVLGTDLPSPVTSPNSADVFTGPKGAAEIDVNMEYSAGCQRGHTSRLTIPISPAWRVHVVGKEVPGKRVVLQVQVTSCLSCSAEITSLVLEPQPGFTAQDHSAELSCLLPMTVPPNGSASFLLFVAISSDKAGFAQGARQGRLNSSLQLHYRHSVHSPPAASLQEVTNEAASQMLDPRSFSLPPPARNNSSEMEEAVQMHAFGLDLGAASSAPCSTVYIRLLGPFAAKSGEMATFCWRLERSSDLSSQQESSTLQYEVKAEGEAWRPSGVRSGTVRLPPERSAATVEATWVPISTGMLPVPQLLLPNIPHQEVFDVGDSNHFINVS